MRPAGLPWPVQAIAGPVGGGVPPIGPPPLGSGLSRPEATAQGGEVRADVEPGSAAAVVATDEEVGWWVESVGERAGVAAFRRAARSDNTLAAYRADWARFGAWCDRNGVDALPAEAGVVAAYLADAANTTTTTGRSAPWAYSPNTLARWVATINKAHDLAGHLAPGRAPEVREVLAGVRRSRATPPRRKTPLLLADLERAVAGIPVAGWPTTPGGIRNRCLLVMGWVGAFRRSELASLTVDDVVLHPEDGLHVLVRVSKTDPEAHGRTYALPYARQPVLCAPCAWLRWRAVIDAADGTDGGPGGRAGVMRACRGLDVDTHVCRTSQAAQWTDQPAGERSQSLFRAVKANGAIGGPIDGHAITAVVKQAAAAVGFDPAHIGGHSLRAGFVTQAFRSGADAHSIMRQTGHRDPKTLEIYARESAPLVGNAVTLVGL